MTREDQDAIDGVAKLAAGTLPAAFKVAVVAYDPSARTFCVMGNLALVRLEAIARTAKIYKSGAKE